MTAAGILGLVVSWALFHNCDVIDSTAFELFGLRISLPLAALGVAAVLIRTWGGSSALKQARTAAALNLLFFVPLTYDVSYAINAALDPGPEKTTSLLVDYKHLQHSRRTKNTCSVRSKQWHSSADALELPYDACFSINEGRSWVTVRTTPGGLGFERLRSWSIGKP